MALGWLWLYSRYRRNKHELESFQEERLFEEEICASCGQPRFRHADDENESCPTYP